MQKIAGGKLDRNGEPVLRIDEKAACINSANERRMGVNEDHSKIAKLHNGDGSPYHFIKTHIHEVVDHARIITTTRMRRKFIQCVLLGLRAYFSHVLRSVSSPSVLLLAEYSDINAICDILEEPNILEEPDNSLLHYVFPFIIVYQRHHMRSSTSRKMIDLLCGTNPTIPAASAHEPE